VSSGLAPGFPHLLITLYGIPVYIARGKTSFFIFFQKYFAGIYKKKKGTVTDPQVTRRGARHHGRRLHEIGVAGVVYKLSPLINKWQLSRIP
jgi:hypothetical protein